MERGKPGEGFQSAFLVLESSPERFAGNDCAAQPEEGYRASRCTKHGPISLILGDTDE